jgi:rare lipoprotein A
MQNPTRALGLSATLLCMLATGCHHKKQVAYQPPPSLHNRTPAEPRRTEPADLDASSIEAEIASAPPGYFDDISARPVLTEEGMASWYVTNYRGRAMADGTMGAQNAMTAAHRTLPMGSTARITNLTTGQQVLVRITDRGPFVRGRVLDLSEGAAKAIGLYRAGVADVRIEAFAHRTTDLEGHWCVQTGVFKTEHDAVDLKEALLRRYRGSQVSEFAGADGYWVRIDPVGRDKASAEKIEHWIGAPDKFSQAYLVRTD